MLLLQVTSYLGEIVFCFKDCSNLLWEKIVTADIKQIQYIGTIKILIGTNNWDVKKIQEQVRKCENLPVNHFLDICTAKVLSAKKDRKSYWHTDKENICLHNSQTLCQIFFFAKQMFRRAYFPCSMVFVCKQSMYVQRNPP